MTPQPLTHTKPKHCIRWSYRKVLKSNSSSKAKLQEPDPFDGSDSVNFALSFYSANSLPRSQDLFGSDTDKVNYVLSFLKGTALDCFESAILDPVEPAWLSDFNLFLEELEANSEPMIQLVKQKLNSKDFGCTTVIKPRSTLSSSSS